MFVLTLLLYFLVKRNSLGSDRLYVAPDNSGYRLISGLYKNEMEDTEEVPILIDGVQGTVLVSEECVKTGG